MNSHITFYVFVLDMVALVPIAIEGVHWAKDRWPKFTCDVDGCDASYTTKYNLVRHLQVCHNVTMQLSKPKCPCIQEHGSKVQDHMVINTWVLSNLLAWFHCNEQKAIPKARRHAFLKWDRLQVDL